MKVVIYTECYYEGGLDTFISTLINYWPSESDEIIFLCNSEHAGYDSVLRRINRNNTEAKKVRVYSPATISKLFENWPSLVRKSLVGFLRIPSFIITYLRLTHLFKELGADRCIVVNGGYPAGQSCLAASIAWKNYKPDAPAIHNFHNYATPESVLFGRWERWIDKKVAESTESFVSVSKSCAESINNRASLSSVKPRFIYNGIQRPESISPVALEEVKERLIKLGIGESSKVCVLLATYEERKGHDFLFKAFEYVLNSYNGDVHLLVCGFYTENDFKRVSSLKNLIITKSHNVHLEGFFPNPAAVIEKSDLVLVSSQAYESFGLTSVEAMSRGVPVVATDVGGIPEVVKSNDGGMLVPSEDYVAFGDAILKLLSDSDFYTEQSEKGRLRYARLFESERMSKEYYDLLS
ncbi:glycosyltransferase family 4 protein [Thaumasiovibrio subtropicus]|uniref:glycosyltransferase family 4 protein n=1 Tax=Thaumasiovibrio subtropicus TaxID=1891207 RepID=UPI000B350465|nr:glycosyltransferase family 4 protein [Thaumasiovibrio subtropicus]